MENSGKSITLRLGWLMVLALGILMTLGGLESLLFAYRSGNEAPGGVSMQELSKLSPELPVALRGRRATAASLAITCGILISWLAAVPFRRGEKWAWWALLCSVGLGSLLSVLRISALGTKTGIAGPGIFFIWLIVALSISYRNMK